MQLKYDPRSLLFRTALFWEHEGKMGWSLSIDDPALKKYEILIEIKDNDEWFRINVDDKFNYLLSRGSEGEWKLQNPNELDNNESQLGHVIIKKEGKIKREYHKFSLFWDDIKHE